MIVFALALLAAAPAPPLDCGAMKCELFATPAQAFQKVLAAKPRVMSIGEVHQSNTSTAGIRSSIGRFTKEMLPKLEHKTSDLIAETWVSEGDCGIEEK